MNEISAEIPGRSLSSDFLCKNTEHYDVMTTICNFDMIHFFIYLNSSLPTLFTKTTKDNVMFHDK